MKLSQVLAAILFPKRCPFCGTVIPYTARCCAACEKILPRTGSGLCRGCGKSPCVCGEDWPLDGVFPAFEYRGEAARAIRQMKFHDRPAIARHLAPYLAEILPEGLSFDAIVPIPMNRSGIRRRGYNQAALLARFLSRETGIPWEELLVKVRKTRPQHMLNAWERRSNLSGAYAPAKGAAIQGRILLLCDDVTTTGATLREAAGILRQNGARAVYAVTAAATGLSNMQDGPLETESF